MSDIEEAYRILDLRVGATYRQVSEARDDLLALWDPRRLGDRPRLRARAARKVQEINHAYDVLMEHLGQSSRSEEILTASSREIPGSGEVRETDKKPAASLFDEVFSKRPKLQGRRQIPVWAIVAVSSAVIIILILLVPSFQSAPVPAPAEGLAEPAGDVVGDVQNDSSSEETSSLETVPAEESKTAPAEKEEVKDETEPPTPVKARAQTSQPPAPAPPEPSGQGTVRSAPIRKSEVRSAPTTPTPRLLRGSAQAAAGPDEEKVREQDEKAYRTLLEKAPAAQRLAGGNFSDFRLQRWEVVERKDSEVWLDLVATGGDGSAVHFIWAVDLEGGASRPLSTAARELEKRDN